MSDLHSYDIKYPNNRQEGALILSLQLAVTQKRDIRCGIIFHKISLHPVELKAFTLQHVLLNAELLFNGRL